MVNRNKGLIWKTGEFDTSMLSNEYYYFKVIEDEINIQDIKEFSSEYTMNNVEFEIQDKLNEVIKAIKQLDNKIKEK